MSLDGLHNIVHYQGFSHVLLQMYKSKLKICRTYIISRRRQPHEDGRYYLRITLGCSEMIALAVRQNQIIFILRIFVILLQLSGHFYMNFSFEFARVSPVMMIFKRFRVFLTLMNSLVHRKPCCTICGAFLQLTCREGKIGTFLQFLQEDIKILKIRVSGV